ncbi:MAG TPA: hypothetical protein DCZ94_13915 [Lentisphaeria bacterium]|nr:MAG: hypothetical protein A2X48_03735 [Lentisphaerae bacterium GWF2_49_21]HBC88041.1 hypothetical protein [Lentisphaeria bacterium]
MLKIAKPATSVLRFTLIELIASMGVFAVLMLILMTFFDSAQRTWTESYNRSLAYENARIAFDLIERDLQCIYYQQENVPFWHKAATAAAWTAYRNQMLAFVSQTPVPPNSYCESKLCEIKYQLYYASDHNDANDGWLLRSATGDKSDANIDNSKWNFNQNFTVGLSDALNAFTGNTDSSDDFDKIIPYVTDLSFTCYKLNGSEITPDSSGTATTEFPYSIRVDITLMDRNSFAKWQNLDRGGTANAAQFKNDRSRKFSKTFLIGERGQYE